MKVIVGMSGGVDSSVAAYLLKKKGFEVFGAFFDMLGNEKSKNEFEKAKAVGALLGIEILKVDVKKEFEKEIIKTFLENYKKGFTPNPCVFCNEKIKFSLAFEKAEEVFGKALFATGHYARIEKEERAHLKKGVDKRKDQSYMLWRLKQNMLFRTILPLGEYTKEEVFRIAEEIGLPETYRESQDVCFINGKLADFLHRHFPEKEGNILNTKGEVIGKHKGAYFYTVGQRSGLGVSYKEPLYVVKTDIKTNTVVLGTREECTFGKAVIFDANFIEGWGGEEKKLSCKVRYRAKEVPCTLKKDSGKTIVLFEEKVFAVASGQSLVLYQGDYVFGGGVIQKAE